jgi:hypothetical protein
VIESLARARLGLLQHLPSFATFGSDWSRRVARIRATALAVVGVPSANSINPRKVNTPMDFLTGYKTYIIGFIMLLAGLCQVLGVPLALDAHSAGQLLLEGAAIVFLRKGIKTDTSDD